MYDLVVRDLDLLLTMDAASGAGPLGRSEHAAVAIDGGVVRWIGRSADAPKGRDAVDGRGLVALPGLVDCHTHTVWGGSRADEFRRRLAGERYEDLLAAGGGILSTVRATRAASEDALVDVAAARLARMRGRGVTTVEVKSGYGLDAETEVRMLRAARRAGERAGVRVIRTFLGAHAVPAEHRADRARYVDEVVDVQLPLAAAEADACDVYVDIGAFTVDEGRRVLRAGLAYGLRARVHAEQIGFTGAAKMAAELGALSADHLERVDDEGIAAMARAGTVAVLLPVAMLWLRDIAPPVAKLRAAGVPMAVATDLNPGTSPVLDLWACASLACVAMGLTVEEALWGITRGGALAVGRPDLGRIAVGDPAELVLVAPPPGEPAEEGPLVQYLSGVEVRRVIA